MKALAVIVLHSLVYGVSSWVAASIVCSEHTEWHIGHMAYAIFVVCWMMEILFRR